MHVVFGAGRRRFVACMGNPASRTYRVSVRCSAPGGRASSLCRNSQKSEALMQTRRAFIMRTHTRDPQIIETAMWSCVRCLFCGLICAYVMQAPARSSSGSHGPFLPRRPRRGPRFEGGSDRPSALTSRAPGLRAGAGDVGTSAQILRKRVMMEGS